MGLIIVPSQTVAGEAVPFTVHVSRMVGLDDGDERLELQAHSITRRGHDFQLRNGFTCFIFTCTVRRDVALQKIVNAGLQHIRLFLSTTDAVYEQPAGLQATKAFVLAAKPGEVGEFMVPKR